MARKPLPDVESPAAPALEGAVITRAEQKKLEELRQQSATVMSSINLSASYSFESFVEIVKSQAQLCRNSAVTLGAALLAIRANEPAQRFHWVLEQCDIGGSSAYALMALARHTAKSSGHRKLGETLGIKKALALFARLDDDEIEAIAYDEDQLDELAGKSVRELTAELKKAKDELAEAKEAHDLQLQRKDKKINALDLKLQERSKADPNEQLAGELMVEFEAAVAEAHVALTKAANLVSKFHELDNKVGNVLPAAINEEMRSAARLLANRVGTLQSFRGMK